MPNGCFVTVQKMAEVCYHLDLEVYKHSGGASKDGLRPLRWEHHHASSTLTPPALGRTCHSSALSGSVLFVVAVTMR